MAALVSTFICPICEEEYFDEVEADECLYSCKWSLFVEESVAYVCFRCGDKFNTKSGAEQHEQNCTASIDTQNENNLTCAICEHCDVEMHRWSPCPKNHFAKVQPACEAFTFSAELAQ